MGHGGVLERANAVTLASRRSVTHALHAGLRAGLCVLMACRSGLHSGRTAECLGGSCRAGSTVQGATRWALTGCRERVSYRHAGATTTRACAH